MNEIIDSEIENKIIAIDLLRNEKIIKLTNLIKEINELNAEKRSLLNGGNE